MFRDVLGKFLFDYIPEEDLVHNIELVSTQLIYSK